MFKIIKRTAAILLALLIATAAAFVTLVGPWPLYRDAKYKQSAYYARAIAAVDAAADAASTVKQLAPLQAGWAEREITPPPGHPIAGYGGRPNDKRSEGVREPLFVRAVALHDGADTVVLVGSDMLQTLPNLLEAVEARVSAATSLTNNNIFYTRSHTHGGPGGLAPGFAAKLSYGPYAPEYFEVLTKAFAEAIIEAASTMAPARLAHGAADAPEYIRNRARPDGPTDSTLHIAFVERISDQKRIYLARYSAHCTAYGEEMLLFHNDYAGAFQRAVRERTEMPLLFMGGAVGAMRPHPPGPALPEPWTPELAMGFENDIEMALVREGKKTLEQSLRDQEARVEAMGAALADLLLQEAANWISVDQADIASFEVYYQPPPAQVRIVSPRWRLSPFAFKLLGVPTKGRMQAARLGDMFLIGMPYDFGGETSAAWQTWAREQEAELWVTSFSGAYLGYLSPDKYYYDLGEGYRYNQNYEIGMMNWFGPNQEAYVTDLFQRAFMGLSQH